MEKSKNGANKEKTSNNALDQTANILKQIKILNVLFMILLFISRNKTSLIFAIITTLWQIC